MADGRTILLFTRAPEVEARAKQLPVAEGSRLFTGFLKAWQQRAVDVGAELVVVTPASSAPAVSRLLPDTFIAVQSGKSFGARVESTFAFAFARGATAVLMVGGDGPPLAVSDIHDSFAHLEAHDHALVITPASDGGVNAIGFSAAAERPLAAIAWQSSDVCSQLKLEADRLGLALLVTSPGYDLDCAANVAALYRLSRKEAGWSAFRWLLLSLLVACRSAARLVAHAVNRLTADSRVPRGPPLSSFA